VTQRLDAIAQRESGPPFVSWSKKSDPLSDLRHHLGLDRYPNLTREEEVSLGQAIELGNKAKALLGEKVRMKSDVLEPCPPPKEFLWSDLERCTEHELAWVADRGELAFSVFVLSNLRLVVWAAKKFLPIRADSAEILDLVQDGTLGLITSVEKWEWRSGRRFSTYASWWIRIKMQRGQKADQHIRLPPKVQEKVQKWRKERIVFAADNARPATDAEMIEILGMTQDAYANLERAMGLRTVSMDAPVSAGVTGKLLLDHLQDDIDYEEDLHNAMLRSSIAEMVRELPKEEALVITHRYGLDGRGERTFLQVSRTLSCSTQRASNILTRGLRRLKQKDTLEWLREDFAEP
jgi:RNA polymerase primary sigma factor